ncbi:murein biosynthesis integral membrane protein MurJ [Alkalinema pantanalense CENA528]|uniref:murein biosynthesis integral membrane protein MurJ n=1 Tax=Alkalinema pantanalense TaxID=1620705 RepID=UPI003D6DF235
MSEEAPKKRSLVNIASIVAVATLISKVFGLVRQVALAAAFGVGSAYGAYQYSTIIPSFFLILLGGINGPFHSAMVSVLAKKEKKDVAPIVETVSTMVGLVLLGMTVLVVILAPYLITLIAPGLVTKAPEVRDIAIQQLRIMAPTFWFAGMIGIGFGALNASDIYWLPSVSPLISSLAVVAAVAGLAITLGSKIAAPENALLGGMVLAGAFVAGTVLQWIAQAIVQKREGLGNLRLRFDWHNPAVKEVTRVMGPALFASGMLQINVYTDMIFTSFLPNPAAAVSALDYANLLVQTPLGILSNMILVPFLPVFSRLTSPENWPELKQRIRQGVLITAIAMLPLGALIITLSKPIVRIVYERGAFDPNASYIVGSVLVAYAVGMFVYLGRDVLVRVFYALGDGNTPFRISMVNIFLNALFDYLLLPLGAPGLVLATVSVNVISMVALTYYLNRKLHGLGWQSWGFAIGGLTIASGLAGLASWGILTQLEKLLGTEGVGIQLVQLAIAGGGGLAVFGAISSQLRLPELNLFVGRLLGRFQRRKG